MADKDIERLIREVRKAEGWRVERGSKHYKCFSPDGEVIVIVPTTPSSRNTIKRVRADFRRAGLELERGR